MDLLACVIGGLLGSSHCIGMCGGFALTLGTVSSRLSPAVVRQLVYSLGRLFTYGFLGAMGGWLGARLAETELPLVGAQQVLSIVAGVMMLYIGLDNLGLIPLRRRRSDVGTGPCSTLLGHFIQGKGMGPAFMAGVFTGFLPCGLVYTFLALAISRGHPAEGWLMMVCFGAGTVPAMVVLGCGSSLLSKAVRVRVHQLASCFVIVLGIITVARGWPGSPDHCCPPHADAARVMSPVDPAAV